ncbi:hypothetical protein PT974_07524 [Cladobotryum mycophilum]|uniref:P-loop containing nucleoside triphosphate hydrolase protein n=1 Tax=Cladobotryum mycophilum TaxID=491253 RepID=A0ABR0SPV3_9HYPO
MGGVPSIPTDRSRTLQVIGAGYSRTGTVSMSLALEKLLDGPAMHGGTQLLGREDAYAKLWVDIFKNRTNKPVLLKLLREATAGFVAITDAPALQFIPELLEIYPDAKVVLVTRDPERWLKSIEAIQGSIGNWSVLDVVFWPCPTWRWFPTWIRAYADWDARRFGDKLCKERLGWYNDWVKSLVPEDRLLTMELTQGWEPLAKFLDKPVPEEPFPRANESESMKSTARSIFQTALLTWAGIIATSGVVGWVSLRVVKNIA